MARVNPVFGMTTGKIGNLAFRNWNGINTVSQQPSGYTDANTPVQQGNRLRMAALTTLLRQALGAIRVGYGNYRQKTSAWSTAIKENSPAFIQVGNSYTWSPELMKYAKGNLDKPADLTADVSGAGELTINWSNIASTATGSALDEINIVIVDGLHKTTIVRMEVTPRSTGQAIVEYDPAYFQGAYANVYAFFTSTTDRAVSDSVYVQVEL